MSDGREIEIKFRIEDVPLLTRKLGKAGFRMVTGRTHEMNTLYDLPGSPLRRRGALLRIRKYGSKWTVTYKDRSRVGRHKTRREVETPVEDGQALVQILEACGFKPGFAYEKFRSEWSGGPSLTSGVEAGPPGGVETPKRGSVVIDETPIGNFGEIEGPPGWIDEVARQLEISEDLFITASYAELFVRWRKKTGSKVRDMRFPL
jgi:adenylate cyclase class 2